MRPARRLTHRSWQSAFAAAAVAASVALPVVLLSVGGGVLQHEVDDLENAGYEITVSAPGLHGIGGAHALSARIDDLARVGSASPILSSPVDAFHGAQGPIPTLAEGVIPEAFTATESPSLRPLFPDPLPLGDPTDLTHFDNGTYRGPATNDLLLSTPFAESIGASVGSVVELAPTADRSGAIAFNVTAEIGSASTIGTTAAYAIVLPLSDLQVLTGFARSNGSSGALLDAADTVEVSLSGSAAADPSAVAEVANEVQGLVPFYGVSTLSTQAQQLEQASAVLDGFYLGLSSVGLSIGLVFLAVVLVRRVESERRAIGVMRAIGVPARDVALGWIRQALELAAVGAAGGVFGGWLLIEGLSRYGSPTVQAAVGFAIFNPVELAAVAAGVLLLSLLASVAATRAALRISIPEALR
jgi:ABC-type lipoprotein release transport system permease subunit